MSSLFHLNKLGTKVNRIRSQENEHIRTKNMQCHSANHHKEVAMGNFTYIYIV